MSKRQTKWHPIETAPRDGTKVLIWLPHEESVAWAAWQPAKEDRGLVCPNRWEWGEGIRTTWVIDHPGAAKYWAALEPPTPTGAHHDEVAPQ